MSSRCESILRRYEFINTNGVDQMLELYARVCTRIRLEPDRRMRFGCRTGQVAIASVMLLADRFEGGFRVWTDDDRDDLLMLTLPVGGGRGSVDVEGKEHPLLSGRHGVIGTASRPHAFVLAPGYEALHLALSRADLQATISAIAGIDEHPYLDFEPSIELDRGGGGALLRFVEFVVSELDRDPAAVLSPVVAARHAELLKTLVLNALPHNCGALMTKTVHAAEPRYVRRAAEYLEAHADMPLSLSEVAVAVGVGVRTLQAGFRKHFDTTPMAFLRDRRLELARRRLLTTPMASVTDVAHACGFDHLGRFSQLYRMRFGETPSQSRRRTFGKRR